MSQNGKNNNILLVIGGLIFFTLMMLIFYIFFRYWEHIPLNFIKTGTKMMFHANFDSYNGAVNLDNIHIYTKQKCIPRWSRIPDMAFHDTWELNDVIMPTPLDTRAYDFSFLDKNKMVNRFYNSKHNGGQGMERCARYKQNNFAHVFGHE